MQTRKKTADENDPATGRLAQVLSDTQQHLRTVVAEHETAVEELRALNDEARSTNEELSTVNNELRTFNEEIALSNSDLMNILSGVEIPILLIGNGLQIRRFNDPAARVLNLTTGDIGRPLVDIRPNVAVADLDRLVRGVIGSHAVRTQEVQDREGRWYSMKIRSYRSLDDRIGGALVTFEDIDGLKKGMQRIKQAREYAEAIVETVREALIVLDSGLRTVTANRAFYQIFAASPEKTEGRPLFELQDGLWDRPDLRQLLEGVIGEGGSFNDFEIDYETPRAGRRILHLNARRVAREGPESPLVLLAVEDVTARRVAEEERDRIHRDHVEALSQVKTLSGMLPICSSCKKIRDDKGYWEQIESYIREHSEAEFSHGMCPDCAKKLYPKYFNNEDGK